MLTRLLFVVAFLQVFSLQACFAFLEEDQENKIPHTPSTPLKRPPEKSIFSPLTILENKFSPVRSALAIKKTLHGSVSPGSIGKIYEDIAPELLRPETYLDPTILDLEKSLELMRLGHNPITYDGQKTEVHHLAQTPRRKILLPKGLHRSRNRYIVTKKNLLSGEVTVVATRLSRQEAEEIIKASEAETLEKGENVKFHLIGNILHPAAGPSRINRKKFNIERQEMLKEAAENLIFSIT